MIETLFFCFCDFLRLGRVNAVVLTITEPDRCVKNVDKAKRIFIEHGDFIYSIIRYKIKDEMEAEDLFHDFFLSLIFKPIPEDIQNIRCFLYRVVSDKTKDAIRRIARYQKRIQRYAQHRSNISESRPENAIIDKEETEKMFKLIRRCLLHLPPQEAKAVKLRYLNDDRIGNVAEKMGIKPTSASRYVSAGLGKVRQFLNTNKRKNYDKY